MPELPTIEIQSPKDPSQRLIINAENFDPEVHTPWGSEPKPVAAEAMPEPVMAAAEEPEPSSFVPSVEDFEVDDDGSEFVNIIDPDNQRRRKRIPVSEYDPDMHRLWSMHPRFQR